MVRKRAAIRCRHVRPPDYNALCATRRYFRRGIRRQCQNPDVGQHVCSEQRGAAAIGNQRIQLGQGDYRIDSIFGPAQAERDVGGAAPGDAKDRFDRDQAARAKDADAAAPAYALFAQRRRQACGPAREFAIAQLDAVGKKRQPVGRAATLLEDGEDRIPVHDSCGYCRRACHRWPADDSGWRRLRVVAARVAPG